jgi:hypothetical protein
LIFPIFYAGTVVYSSEYSHFSCERQHYIFERLLLLHTVSAIFASDPARLPTERLASVTGHFAALKNRKAAKKNIFSALKNEKAALKIRFAALKNRKQH